MAHRLKTRADVEARIADLRELWQTANPELRRIIEVEAKCLKTLAPVLS